MNNWYTLFLYLLGGHEPKSVAQKRKLDQAVRQRKEACLLLNRAIRDVRLAPQKK